MKNSNPVCIKILNWDKYQRPLRGKGGAESRRAWVAISTDLCRSNDYLMLDLLHRNVWVMLLCHAGVVGPVFDLCPTVARRMFDLPRTPDFSVLEKQGLIEIGVTCKSKKRVLHNITRQDKTEHKGETKKAPAKGSRFVPDDFAPNEKTQSWIKENCPGIDTTRELLKFKNFEFKTPKRDFQRTFRNWCVNAMQYSKPDESPPGMATIKGGL